MESGGLRSARASGAPPTPWWSAATERWASAAFGLVLVVAVPVLFRAGSDQWFVSDDFWFLSLREPGRLSSWYAPHNEHWTTLPWLVYRVLWSVFGLTYWPYQLVGFLLHLVVSALLWAVMRRSGVHPWLSTIAASSMVFLGSGRENIVVAFQMTFTGAIALGIGHLLLADHDGPFGRRDLAAMACGVGAIATSGVGLPIVAATGIAVTLRRGWRVATMHLVPLAALYLAWMAVRGPARSAPSGDIGATTTYAIRLLHNGLDRHSQHALTTLLLLVLAVVSLVIGIRLGRGPVVRAWAAPLCLSAAGLLLAFTIARTRSAGAFGGTVSPFSLRYVYVTVALLLPSLVVGLSDLARRYRKLLVPLAALLLLGIPGNLRALLHGWDDHEIRGGPHLVLTVAALAEHSDAPAELRPLPRHAPMITVGWLRSGRQSGAIPDPPSDTPAEVTGRAELHMAIGELPPPARSTAGCTPVADAAVGLRKGERLTVAGPRMEVRRIGADGRPDAEITIREISGADSMDLLITTDIRVELEAVDAIHRCPV